MEKISANLPGIHDTRTLSSTGRRSIPPSEKSAFLDLFMRQSEKDRLAKEKIRLRKKTKQVNQNLTMVNKRMTNLLKIATKGSKRLGKMAEERTHSKSTVLEY